MESRSIIILAKQSIFEIKGVKDLNNHLLMVLLKNICLILFDAINMSCKGSCHVYWN